MIGYVNGNGKVGETEYGRMQVKAMIKSQINVVNRVLSSELGGESTMLPNLSSVSKQVLRVLATYSLLTMAECTEVYAVQKTLTEVSQGAAMFYFSNFSR